MSEGRILGPFKHPSLENLQVSPLGVVPNQNKGEYRLIQRLSYPEEESVNDAIPEELCTVCYASFDEVVHMVCRCGIGAELAKCDIKSAFCILPVHPLDFDLLDFYFQGSYYIDRALPMGCSVSCTAFKCFSSFLEWKHRCTVDCRSTAHYLDDYLFCGAAHTGQCVFILETFQSLSWEHGEFPWLRKTTEGPASSLTFLGIELGTMQQASRLLEDKLEALEE